MSKSFNEYRFNGLHYISWSNKYYTMHRVSDDEDRIVVKVDDSNLFPTKYGYGYIIDRTHVAWLKSWAVSINWYGNEVMLDKRYFNVKESNKPFEGFSDNYGEVDDNTGCKVGTWDYELAIAKKQQSADNMVKWAK